MAPGTQESEEAVGSGGEILHSSVIKEAEEVVSVENGMAIENQLTVELGRCIGGESAVASVNAMNAEELSVGGEVGGTSANQETEVGVGINGENGVALLEQVTSKLGELNAETLVVSDNRLNGETCCVAGENEVEPGSIGGDTGEARGVGGEIELASTNQVTVETKVIGSEIEVAFDNHVNEEANETTPANEIGDAGGVVEVSSMGKLMCKQAEGVGGEIGVASANDETWETKCVGGDIEVASMNHGTEESGVAYVNRLNGDAEGKGNENGATSARKVAGRAIGAGGESEVPFTSKVNGVGEGDGGEIREVSVNDMTGNAVGDGGEIGTAVNDMAENAVGEGGVSRVPSANHANGVAEGISVGIGVASANQVVEEALRGDDETGMLSSGQVNGISEGVGGEIKVSLANQVNREARCVGGGFGVVEKHKWVETKVYRRRPKGEKNKGVLRRQIEKLHFSQVNTRESNTIDERNHNDNHLEINGATEGDKIISVLCTSQFQPDTIVDVVSNTVLSTAGIDCVTPIPITPLITNGAMNPLLSASDGKVKVNLSSTAKLELQQLKRKIESELYSVRKAVKKMDGVREEIVPEIHHPVVNNNLVLNGARNEGFATRAYSGTASLGHAPYKPNIRPYNQLRVSVVENSYGMVDSIEREKRTPKANQFYRNTEFLLANDKFPPVESNKKSKSNGQRSSGGEFGFGVGSKVYKGCSALLEKLMKHKHGWVFNAPVDVKALGLHDYFLFVKNPMDLGTVKARLIKYWYKSPMEFAEDVRLTFHNAMMYNPKGHDVHIMAETLWKIFEGKWPDIEVKYLRELRSAVDHDMGFPTPTSRITNPFQSQAVPPLETRVFSNSELMPHSVTPKPRTLTPAPSFKAPALQKPKAKDVNKREMTYGEKQKLSTNLQGLPPEKLDGVIQIIKKRSTALSQNDDEIEVDIDSVDTETLWELDRYVSNWKKSLSKHRRKAELANQMRAEAQQAAEKITTTQLVPPMESTTGYGNATLPPPTHRKNPAANVIGSSSSSSSSSSGSSSDSDSDSSSEESDGGHSPGT